MLIDKSHKRWGLVTGVSFVLSCIAYAVYARGTVGGPRGGSLPGLCFGIVGSALMIFAGLIAARKRVPKWRIGSAQFWLRGHLWLGTLGMPLILFHAGFRWGGLLEQLLLLVLAGVVVSGAFGLVLQQFLPRQMTARVPLETFYAQIPRVCDVLQVEGDVTVADLCGPLPVAPNTEVATIELLDLLGVKEKREVAKKQDHVKDKGKEKSAEEVEQEKLRKLLASVYEPLRDGDPAAHLSGKVEAAVSKATSKADATPSTTSELAPVPVESVASFNPERGTAPPSPPAAPQEGKAMTPAEKIALMKAKKAAAGGSAVAAPVAPAVAKSVPAPRKQQPLVDDAWKEFGPEFKRFYLADVRPFLGRAFSHGGSMADDAVADGRFALERNRLPQELHAALDELSQLCEERRQLVAQARIHHWVHGWLFVHVSLSMALLGLGAVHAVMSIYY